MLTLNRIVSARCDRIGPHLRRTFGIAIVGVLASFGAVANCSSATGPVARPTILVTNAVCAVGSCRTLVIHAFIWGWKIPQPPTGIRVLGYVRGATTCLQFPSEWSIESGTVGDLQQLTWKPNDPAGIFLLAFDSAFTSGTATTAQNDSSSNKLWPYQSGGGLIGVTPTVVPGTSAGWSVTFPSTSLTGSPEPSLVASAACSSPQQPPPQPTGPAQGLAATDAQ
jgi:hypothetical protein